MSLANHFRQTTYLGYLVLPRVALGYFFVRVALAKFNSGYLGTDALARQLSESVLRDPVSWHRDFIQGVVIPHAGLFSYLVCYGEIAIGVALITGCLVRLASLFGAVENLNILLASAVGGQTAQLGLNLLAITLHLVFVLASAGRVLGIDAILKKKYPQSWWV